MAKSRKRRKTRRRPHAAPRVEAIAAPKPKRRTGRPPPRKTTHKKRSAWFRARVAWPAREARVHALVRERSRVTATMAPQPGVAQWQLVGPTNVGGRMTCVVCAAHRPETIWAGAAGGGVWKSDDGGAHWRALWHREATLNIGSLAIDPTNPATLYCGTGEANLSADSYPGVGIYRSIDGGESWQLLAPAEANHLPTRIGAIAVDPFDPSHIRIGGVAHDYAGTDVCDGLFVSRNGGLSWGRETFVSTAPYRCHAVLFHPSARGTLFATIAARGSRSGIWKSTNGGASWTQLRNGLPAPDAIGRMSLAISPSRPVVMYALAEDKSEGVLGVFRSVNGGASWINVAGTHFDREDQMSYNNTIVVHPVNHDHVLCGGVDLHRTTNGGKTWHRATKSNGKSHDKHYAHADHHCLLMPPARPGLVYDMNDGGMDVSTDGGRTWTNRSNGLAATMFYDLDVAPSDGRMFGGGAQDNGTNVTCKGAADQFKEVHGGDGGWMVIDPRDKQHYYATAQNMEIVRFRGGPSVNVSPPAKRSEWEAVWMVFLDMDPNNSRTLFAGGLRVWRTRNDGTRWHAVSEILDDSPISAVEIAQANSRMVYVGTENGGIFRSMDGGDNWSEDLSGPLPGFTITRLLTSPIDAGIVYATIANFGASHVFRSKDGGQTWTDIDRGRLPDVPHHAIAIPRRKPSTLYVCSDAGVFVSTNAGGDWKNLTRNLPNVPTVDLVYHERDRTLTAASYGRSLWRLQI
jgi:photosystem II stability/assembly factor-like uncharacterized protein